MVINRFDKNSGLKKPKKRKRVIVSAQYERDNERIAENIFQQSGRSVRDRDSFELAFERYTGNPVTNRQKELLLDGIFEKYAERHPNVSDENLFEKAGGKSLKKDREKTAKVVVNTREEYLIKGAQRVDLQGFDTKGGKIVKRQIIRKLDTPAIIINRKTGRRKILKAERSTVTIKGKKRAILRDSKGRFAKKI